MRVLVWLILGLGLASAVQADEETALFDIGPDAYRAGATVVFDAEDVDDLFMAGETLRGVSAITGNAHLLGRRIIMSGDVGGDIYAGGMELEVRGEVAGDATVTGYQVSVGAVGGDLRISGSELVIEGPVDGYALIAGDEVRIAGVIAGDVSVAARTLTFGPEARIEGTLTLYEDEPGTIEVPARVADADRIVRQEIGDWDEDAGRDMVRPFNPGRWIAKFLLGVIIIAGLSALVASLVPEQLASMRRRVLDRPFGTLWLGFLMLSAIVGSAVLFAMTLIGIIVSPAAILLAVAAGLAGYVIGVYAFGVGLMLAVGRSEPETISDKAVAAAAGAVVAGILALIPLLGWLFVLALTLAGVGAITYRVFSPRFYTESY